MPESGHRRSKGDLVSAGLAVLVGALILALAAPRLGAAVWLRLRDREAELVHVGLPVPERDLHGLIASRELALGWVAARGPHADIAAALALLSASEEPESGAERELLGRAADEVRTGLALAPADSRGWLRLAFLTTVLDGRNERAAKALQVSIQTGPYDTPEFLALRLDLALHHWSLFDEAGRRRIEEQIRLAWAEVPGELAELALDEPDYHAIIMSALEDRPEAQRRLTAVMREMMQEARPAAAPNA